MSDATNNLDRHLPDRLLLRGLRHDWNGERTERLLVDVHRRLRWRRRAWRAAMGSVVVAGGVGVVLLMVGRHRESTDSVATVASTPAGVTTEAARIIRLAEGSEIRLGDTNSEVRVTDEGPARVRIEQVRGSSHYAVAPNPARRFEVRAGAVTVTVVGTEFVVERRGEAAWVGVTRGKVRVAWGESEASSVFLTAGEKGVFPPATSSPPVAGVPARSAARTELSYRSKVARRDYRGAYAALSRDPALAGDTVEELLVAADVARLSEHPAQAVPYLQRILREHARDERAPMAAFTLGRTLSGLGRTREAMEQFARVHTAWPGGPLAEDALVREAEAAAALGDSARARRLAEQYERDHPGGSRRAEVRRFARLAPVAPGTPAASGTPAANGK